MLEQKDLEMIAEVMQQALQPVKSDTIGIKSDIQELKDDMKSAKTDIQELKDDMKSAKTDIQQLKNSMTEVKTDISKLKVGVEDLKNDAKAAKTDIAELKDKIESVQNEIQFIETSLENKTNKGIQTIAEGHLDLTRKLDKAMKIEEEKEMLKLRMNWLENEVRELKLKLDKIAGKTA